MSERTMPFSRCAPVTGKGSTAEVLLAVRDSVKLAGAILELAHLCALFQGVRTVAGQGRGLGQI